MAANVSLGAARAPSDTLTADMAANVSLGRLMSANVTLSATAPRVTAPTSVGYRADVSAPPPRRADNPRMRFAAATGASSSVAAASLAIAIRTAVS